MPKIKNSKFVYLMDRAKIPKTMVKNIKNIVPMYTKNEKSRYFVYGNGQRVCIIGA